MSRRRLRSFLTLSRLLSGRYVSRHPGRAGVVVLAVSVGVAAVAATGSLVETALTSFRSPFEADSSGTHFRVANGFAGVPEGLVESLSALAGVSDAAAIVTGSARLRDGLRDVPVVGVDLLADRMHRELLVEHLELVDEMAFIARPESVVLSRALARAHDLVPGATLKAGFRTGARELFVAGLADGIEGAPLLSGEFLLMDLPAAQLVLGRPGIVDTIEVRVREGADLDRVEALLADQVAGRATVRRSGEGFPEGRALIFNLDLTLGVAGAIALVVGALVIYHAVALSAARRKPELDVVHSLGASRRLLVALLAAEGLALGLAGTLLGAAAGLVLAWAASGAFEQALSSLYWPFASTSFRPSTGSLVWGFVLAVSIACLASAFSAFERTRATSGLSVATPSRARWRTAVRLARFGAAALVSGWLVGGLQDERSSADTLALLATTSDILILLGLGLAAPVAVLAVAPTALRRIRSSRGVALRLGWQGLASDAARSSIMVTSIMVGTAYIMISVGTVESIRAEVLAWLRHSQRAALHVAADGSVGFLPAARALPPELGRPIRALPAVRQVDTLQLVLQPFEDRWVVVTGRDPRSLGERRPLAIVGGDLDRARRGMEAGESLIASRNLATKHGIRAGDTLELRAPTGPVRLRVDAIAVEYTGDIGSVMVSPRLFAERWPGLGVAAFDVWLHDGADTNTARAALLEELAPYCDCSVMTRDELMETTSGVIDGMFYAAYALEFVAVIVMIAAVATFFSISLGERRREIDLLRSVGASRAQVVRSFLWEAALLGGLGGVLGSASGAYLAYRIVSSTVRLGSGAVLGFTLPPAIVALAVLAPVLVCVSAAWLQAWWATAPATALAQRGANA